MIICEADPGAGGAAAIAAQLLSASRFAEAARVFEYLCEAEPGAGEHWQERFNALKSAGDVVAAERLWRDLLNGRVPWPPLLNRSGVARQLAGLLEKDFGEPESARRLLWREHKGDRNMGDDLYVELARSCERVGQWEDAALVWKEAARYAATRERRRVPGKNPGAAARPGRRGARLGSTVDGQGGVLPADHARVTLGLAEIQLAGGCVDEALDAGFDLLRGNQPEAVSGVVAMLSRVGEGKAARQLLTAATRRVTEPQSRPALQKALVEQVAELPGGGEDALFKRELRRLRTFAEEMTPLRAVFDDTALRSLA